MAAELSVILGRTTDVGVQTDGPTYMLFYCDACRLDLKDVRSLDMHRLTKAHEERDEVRNSLWVRVGRRARKGPKQLFAFAADNYSE